jgi:hypothetical protein
MTGLILKRAPIGWNQDDFDVIENGVIVGRIFKVPIAPQDRHWMWASGDNGHIRRAAQGYSRRARRRWRRSRRVGGGRILHEAYQDRCAEAHLITAVRAHFQAEHPASVYLLVASAREILTTLGEKTGTRTMLAGLAEDTGTPLKKLVEIAHEFAKFFKHADHDPTVAGDGLFRWWHGGRKSHV